MDITILGMTCRHCQKSVTEAIQAVPGVETVSVDLLTGIADITGSPDEAAVIAAVEEIGFDVV